MRRRVRLTAVPPDLDPPTGTVAPCEPAAPDTGGALAAAERILGHSFARPDLLREALTHRSAAGPEAAGAESNERLEFVGDRVLALVVAEWLAERFPREREGQLARRLGHLVSRPVLAEIAARLGLSAVLTVAPNEVRAGVGRLATVLADALEAMLGALYLDGGLAVASRFIRHAWETAVAAQPDPPKDPKTGLQEWAQAHGMDLPVYTVAARSGPAHAPVFVVQVSIGKPNAPRTEGSGTAGSKREAERLAAEDLLRRLGT